MHFEYGCYVAFLRKLGTQNPPSSPVLWVHMRNLNREGKNHFSYGKMKVQEHV